MLSVWHKADIYRIPIYEPVTVRGMLYMKMSLSVKIKMSLLGWYQVRQPQPVWLYYCAHELYAY